MSSNQAPRGYVPGLGRGAAGFTTRSDIGPAMAKSSSAGPDGALTASSGTGSRAAELREAKMRMRAAQAAVAAGGGPTGLPPGMQVGGNSALPTPGSAFGIAPAGYVAGAGRGAGGGKETAEGGEGPTGYDQFQGYSDRLFGDTPYDNDDEEADRIYDAIDERMNSKSANKRAKLEQQNQSSSTNIGDQFRELKEKLKDVTEDQWDAIPDVGDYSLKYKQKRREDVFTPLTDSLLVSKAQQNNDATASSSTSAVAATTTAGLPSTSGFQSVVTNMSGLAEARGTVLGMSLDKMAQSDSTTGQTVIDPKGYLTSLSSVKIATQAEISDVNKARLLLKSVRDTNPKHAPGWIAAARVEEAANKILQARKLIQQGCETCPENEDVWLEAARLHPPDVAKTVLATAVRRIPYSVKLFLRAADLEHVEASKKAVLRKALENIPTSVTLWKAAIELEDAEDARILLSLAVEKVPHSVEMWLALARLETYDNARKVLNQARRHLSAERSIWIAAAKLEEAHDHPEMVDKIIEKAVKSLLRKDVVVTREQWLKEAETSELVAQSPLTSAAIVKHTVGLNVDLEDRLRTWSSDATSALSRGAVATARAILAHGLTAFPTKRSLWLQAVELERHHGTPQSLDEVLAAASERLPRIEIFWLVRAKEKWLVGDIDMAREILTQAFAANPDSEPVWLAGAKLEWETGEVERARVLLQRARERAPSDRVYMKSALLERQCGRFDDALDLLEQGISNYPTFAKLYMMGGQLCSQDLIKTQPNAIDRARKFYQRGLDRCPDSVILWTLASRLEEHVATSKQQENGSKNGSSSSSKATGYTKARSLLELARLKNPKNPYLWVESIRLERRAGNDKLAGTLMAKALQDCPSSGLLLAENITTAPRVEQKSKSADAIKRCPDDPLVISAVASLFASERKNEKARKWFERAVVLDPDLGDSWAKYYAFELERGTVEQQQKVKERCISAEPKHGEIWSRTMKDMANIRKTVGEGIELVARNVLQQKN